MPVQERKHLGRKLLTVTVLTLLIVLSVANLRIVVGPLGKLIHQDLSFESFINEVQNDYLSDNFICKNGFVNLNGLLARLRGLKTLNEVVKLNNGMLSKPVQKMDRPALASSIRDFSDYLSERSIPFLYVQLPYKESLDGQGYPVGTASYANENADDLLSWLSSEEVETLDLRPLLSQTQEMLEQYFYKTDHHWNSDGAFVAFQEILNYLHKLFPEGNIDLTYAQADQWERHSIDDWFLGSWGKRVGTFYGGTDPLIWYTPKFETEMSCAIPEHGLLLRGDFADANVRERYIEKKDYFNDSAYCVYIGGDYPLVQHRSLSAPSPLKVMMIKDSFSLPLQAFLSTAFQKVDVIDPRYFSECTIAEYAERTKPDIVILAINPDIGENSPYQYFGVEETMPIMAGESAYELVIHQDIAIEAADSFYNYAACLLEPNTIYRVAFEGVDVLEGLPEGVGLCLYDKTANTILQNAIFDITYCEAKDGFSWIFRTPDTQSEFALLFYAGIYGSTAGNGVIYRDVAVEKLSASDS